MLCTSLTSTRLDLNWIRFRWYAIWILKMRFMHLPQHHTFNLHLTIMAKLTISKKISQDSKRSQSSWIGLSVKPLSFSNSKFHTGCLPEICAKIAKKKKKSRKKSFFLHTWYLSFYPGPLCSSLRNCRSILFSSLRSFISFSGSRSCFSCHSF